MDFGTAHQVKLKIPRQVDSTSSEPMEAFVSDINWANVSAMFVLDFKLIRVVN